MSPAEFFLDCAHKDNSRVTELVSTLKKSIDIAYPGPSSHSDNQDGVEAEVDSQSETSDSEDDDESMERIRFYISLLMNLVPSMEHAYNQVLLDLERGSPLLGETSFPKAAESSKSEVSHQSETIRSSLPSIIHSYSAKNDTQISSRTFGNSWANDLRVQFERMWKERPNLLK